MYDTGGSHSVCDNAPAYYDARERVNWLKGELARDERRAALARNGDDEAAAQLMLKPVATEDAYRWFGTFLGLFPPAAIFGRIFQAPFARGDYAWLGFLCLLALALCCSVGRSVGGRLGQKVDNPRARTAVMTLLAALPVAIAWGVITGGTGGLVFFGIGALVGPFFAIPVALAGFLAFMQLHRLLSRGGMIEERHLFPLTFGLPCVIAAAILGM
ncbi:MAG TPA: hypothetical protein VD968_03770 [Pyrinomonadaceae bacterium]|nr:hypothetical protein [Pyrinomonadaceae bacterium]